MERSKLLRYSVIYAVLLIAELLSGSVLSDVTWLHYCTKPLLLICLLVFYLSAFAQQESKVKYWIAAALVFSLAGDVLLLFQDGKPMFFIAGLVAFLIAHASYIVAFLQEKGSEPKTVSKWPLIGFAAAALLYGASLFILLEPKLGVMKVPVLIYESVIMVMATAALARRRKATAVSFQLVFLGAIFFMSSDSLLAINKFYAPLNGAHVWIMSTYGIAQFLIVIGYLKRS